jgi:hypothetical protein
MIAFARSKHTEQLKSATGYANRNSLAGEHTRQEGFHVVFTNSPVKSTFSPAMISPSATSDAKPLWHEPR